MIKKAIPMSCLCHFGKYFGIITNISSLEIYLTEMQACAQNMNVHTHSLCHLVETTETFINNRMDKTPIFACLFNGILQSNEKKNFGHMQQHR